MEQRIEEGRFDSHPKPIGHDHPTGSLRFSSSVLIDFVGTWTLKNFSSLDSRVGTCYRSGIFHASEGMEWRLRIYPGGQKTTEWSRRYVSWVLDCATDNSIGGFKVKYVMSFRNSEDYCIRRFPSDQWEHIGSNGKCGMEGSIEREVLMGSLSDDALVIDVNISCSFTSLMLEGKRFNIGLLSSSAIFMDHFAAIYKGNKLCDAVVSVGATKFDVHRTVLATRSREFAHMLESDSRKDKGNNERPTKRRIEINGFEQRTVQLMLEFLYTGRVNGIDHSEAAKLMKIADKYGLDDLKQYCKHVLICRISPSNCVETLVIAKNLNDADLMTLALNFYCQQESPINFRNHKTLLDQHPNVLYDIIDALQKTISTFLR